MIKDFICKSAFFFLFVCTGIFSTAQISSYKLLAQELQSLTKNIVPDNRTALLEIEIKDTLNTVIVVKGLTDLPEAKAQILSFLSGKNIQFKDSVRVLPDSAVGNKLWALGSLSVSNLRSRPEDSSELVSQFLMGMPLKVLDFSNGWYRVQTPEKYIGWTESTGIQLLTQEELNLWKNSGRWIFKDISGSAFDLPRKKSAVVSDMVLGDLFVVENKSVRYLKIKMPDGRTGYVKRKQCISYNDWSQLQPEINPVIEVAEKMMGFPYLWGGTSAKANDCSGFVKTAFYSRGIILARDASQQARYGETVDFSDFSNLKPGDLLFFGRSAQRITHVGIYLGNGDFIHSSGRVHIGSIFPNDPKYNPKRNLVAARRIINSVDADGIISVKNHPWYNL